MKRILLAASICASCACGGAGAQTVTATDNRYTFYFNPVQALRMPNPAYWDGISRQSVATLLELMVEAILADTYPEAVGLSDAVNWQYLRNCHDYAWQPYMTDDFYSEGYVTQTEAWWTEDPTRNFTDGSMRFWCVSQGVYDGEYYFLKSDLDALKQQYQDVFGNLLQVPVCYDPGFFGFVPDHSGYVATYSTVAGLNPQYVVLGVISKWGGGPLMVHRWSEWGGPYPVDQSAPLAIYVPNYNSEWWVNTAHSLW
ncbi:MAG: hypothetical protein ACLQM8_09285 [Limisphaerales bacterium]